MSTHNKCFCGHIEIVFLFSLRKKNDISCKLTVSMKYQILFSGNNKLNIINLSSAELAQSMAKVKQLNLDISKQHFTILH